MNLFILSSGSVLMHKRVIAISESEHGPCSYPHIAHGFVRLASNDGGMRLRDLFRGEREVILSEFYSTHPTLVVFAYRMDKAKILRMLTAHGVPDLGACEWVQREHLLQAAITSRRYCAMGGIHITIGFAHVYQGILDFITTKASERALAMQRQRAVEAGGAQVPRRSGWRQARAEL